MRTSTLVVSIAIVFAANGCGSSSGGSTGTAGAKGSAGSSGTAGSGTAGAAGADAGAAGSGTAGAGDGGTAGATGGAGGTVDGGSAGADGGGTAGTGGLAACGTSTSPSVGDSCNTVDATGPCVTSTVGSGTPPTPAGGSIVAGTFDLTSLTVYPIADAGTQTGTDTRREALAFSAVTTSTLTLQMTQASGTTIARQAGTVVISGSQVTFTPTCPPPGDAGDNGGSAGFTATSTTFTLFDTGDGGDLRVSVYTKR
jgi:hypothetical protein